MFSDFGPVTAPFGSHQVARGRGLFKRGRDLMTSGGAEEEEETGSSPQDLGGGATFRPEAELSVLSRSEVRVRAQVRRGRYYFSRETEAEVELDTEGRDDPGGAGPGECAGIRRKVGAA